jgi:hypothetical protein
MDKPIPKRPLVYERTEIKIRELAVYATVFVKDADGKLWSFSAASMCFDLLPIS